LSASFSLSNDFSKLGLVATRFKNAMRELFGGSMSGALVAKELETGTQIYKLQQEVGIDVLTRLPNRHTEKSEFENESKIAERDGKFLMVAMFDIDFFKAINDTYGHDAGDTALRHFALVAKKTLRPTDKIFRHGGEEFLVFARTSTQENASALCERLREKLETAPCEHNGEKIKMTASIGFVLSHVDPISSEPRNLDSLVNAADEALYKAKASGRNRTVEAPHIVTHRPTPHSAHDTPAI